MDLLDLPLLPSTASPWQARRAMLQHGKSAVVTREGDEHWLLTAASIAKGAAEGTRSLNKVHKRSVLALSPDETIAEVGWRATVPGPEEVDDPRSHAKAWEDLLDETGFQFALTLPVIPTQGSVTLVTRHERQGVALARPPADCYCTGTREHPYDPGQIPPDLRCTLCGARIVCTR